MADLVAALSLPENAAARMARRNVAEALVAWWRDMGSPRHLIDEAIRPEKLVLPPEMLP